MHLPLHPPLDLPLGPPLDLSLDPPVSVLTLCVALPWNRHVPRDADRTARGPVTEGSQPPPFGIRLRAERRRNRVANDVTSLRT